MITSIGLKSLPNTRELGGIVNKENKTIKHKKLLRSSFLARADKNDLESLISDYNLKTVIDFRSDMEREESPEILPGNIDYMPLKVMPEYTEFAGITKDKKSMSEAIKIVKENGDPNVAFNHMCVMYKVLASSTGCLKAYNKFLNILANDNEGSYLWHCSMGKDRCGTATAILLMTLDVDMDIIKEDYLYTNYCYYGDSLPSDQFKRYYDVVDEGYFNAFIDEIKTKYGDIQSYLRKGIGIEENLKKKLVNLYLED